MIANATPPGSGSKLKEYKFNYENTYITNLNNETLYVSYFRYNNHYRNQVLLPNGNESTSNAYNFSCFRKIDDEYQFVFAVVEGTITGYYSSVGLDENGDVKDNKFISGNFSYYVKE